MTERMEILRDKLERARHHIHDVMAQSLKAIPEDFEVKREIDYDNSEVVISFPEPFQIPRSISIVAGEALHQIRSTLDHAVWALVESAGNSPCYENAFPICKKDTEFEAAKIKAGKRIGKLYGVSTTAQDIIEKFQPLKAQDPERHALSVLAQLSNTDKHRTLNVVGVFANIDYLSFSGPTTGLTLGHNKHVLPGTEICRIRLGAAEVGEELKMETQIRAEIAFEKAGLFEGHPVAPCLGALHDLTRNILDALAGEIG